VGQYQKGETNLDFTEARDSEWQCHQLGHMQVCTSLQTDNHASTPLLSFKALKKFISIIFTEIRSLFYWRFLKLSGARCRLAYGPADAPPLTVQTGFTFLVLAHPGSPGQRAVKRVCVCVCSGESAPLIIGTSKFAKMHRNGRRNATGTVIYDQITSAQNN